jgi:hypothetical protein
MTTSNTSDGSGIDLDWPVPRDAPQHMQPSAPHYELYTVT